MEGRQQASRAALGIAILVIATVAGIGIWKAVQGPDEPEAERSRGLGDYSCTDPSKAYYGNVSMIRRPAVVTLETVYARIPEYQQIRSQGLTDKNPKYYFLLQKTSATFADAVKAAARAGRYDFVAETGTIRREDPDAEEPADLTQAVIAKLR